MSRPRASYSKSAEWSEALHNSIITNVRKTGWQAQSTRTEGEKLGLRTSLQARSNHEQCHISLKKQCLKTANA